MSGLGPIPSTLTGRSDASLELFAMALTVEILAEQMLELTRIISGHHRDVQALRQKCRRLDEHDQAIMVAFTTFFHVLAAGRVAPLHQISGILQTIIDVAEQEHRPPDSIKFLQGLATMLLEHSMKRPDESSRPDRSRESRGES